MKKIVYITLVLSLGLILSYQYVTQDFDRNPPTVYVNGHIITMDAQRPTAEAMFVKDGRITAIGTAEDLKKYTETATKQVDLAGAIVMPGFVDPHSHFALTMFLSEMHDLSGFTHKSNREVWDHFDQVVKKTEKGKWIVCRGIDPILVPDLNPPTLDDLDKIAPENPVLIFSQSLHSYWVNSAAYKIVGITRDTPNPSEHSFYAKDRNGTLNGLIVEQEAIKPFVDVLKSEVLTPEKLSEGANRVMTEYAKNGNTTIVSAGITINDNKPLLLFEHLSSEQPTLLGSVLEKIGVLPERKANPRHFIYIRHDMAHLMPEEKSEADDFYGIIGIKHWYDGSPYIGSMYLNEPYQKSELTNVKLEIPEGSKGEGLVDQDSLKAFIRKFHKAGWQIAMHTQGDAATKEVIDAFEALDAELDYVTSRHRLEHCLLLSSQDLDRMKKLNLTPSYHVNHLYYYGDALKEGLLGEERTRKILPIASTSRKGLKFSLHADQPMFDSRPFRLIQTAVERKTMSGDSISPEQRIEVKEAIRAMTINAAWQIHMEDKIGSLETGKYADFIILDKNPLETPVDELQNIRCLKTFVNGNQVK